jgi:hypothetical protein
LWRAVKRKEKKRKGPKLEISKERKFAHLIVKGWEGAHFGGFL